MEKIPDSRVKQESGELTRQQRIWIWGRTLQRASFPLLLYVIVPAVCLAAGYVLWHQDMSAQEFFTYGGNFYSALGMILTLVILHRRSKKQGSSFFQDATLFLHKAEPKKAAAFVGFGLAAAVTVSAVLTLLPRWGVSTSYTEASQTMFKGRDVLFTVVTTVLTAPLTEEIIFRGYMLNTLMETFEEKQAVWIVSLVFAFCHGSALWILYALLMGLVLSWVAMREDNILYSIFMHMGFNLLSAVVWLVNSTAGGAGLFFSGKWLVAAYGLIGLMVCLLLARRYLSAGKPDEPVG